MKHTIYKYIIIPTDSKHSDKKSLEEKYLYDTKRYKLIAVNTEYSVTMYKCVYCEVVIKNEFFSSSKRKRSIVNFENESLTMFFNTSDVNIPILDSDHFDGTKWIFTNNKDTGIVDKFYNKDIFRLVNRNGEVGAENFNNRSLCKWISNDLSEKVCNLTFPCTSRASEYLEDESAHNYVNSYMIKLHEEIVSMAFILMNYQRDQKIIADRVRKTYNIS